MNLLSMNLKSAIEKLTLILVTVAFLTLSIFAQAKTAANTANVINIREAGVQYEVPQGWRIQQHQDALQITSSDGAVSIIIAVAANDNTEAMIGGACEVGVLIPASSIQPLPCFIQIEADRVTVVVVVVPQDW